MPDAELRARFEDLNLIIVEKKTRETHYLTPIIDDQDRMRAAECARPAGIISPGQRQPMGRNLPVDADQAYQTLRQWTADDWNKSGLKSFKLPLSFRDRDGTALGISWMLHLDRLKSLGEVSYLLGAAYQGKGHGRPLLVGTTEYQQLIPVRQTLAAPYVDWYEGAEEAALYDEKHGTETRKPSASEQLIRRLDFHDKGTEFEAGTPFGRSQKQRMVAGYDIKRELWITNNERDRYEFYALRPLLRDDPEASWEDVLAAAESNDPTAWQRVADACQWGLVEGRYRKVANVPFSTFWAPWPQGIRTHYDLGTRTRLAANPSRVSTRIQKPTTSRQLEKITGFLSEPSLHYGKHEGQNARPREYQQQSEWEKIAGYVEAIAQRGRIVALVDKTSGFRGDVRAVAVLRRRSPTATLPPLESSVVVFDKPRHAILSSTQYSEDSAQVHAQFVRAIALLAYRQQAGARPLVTTPLLGRPDETLPDSRQMLTLSMTVSNSGNGSSTYTQLALPAWMVKQYRSHLDQYVGTTYQLIVNMIDPQKTPLSDHLYWNHYTDMSAKHDILSGRTQQPRMHRVGIDAINAAAHGHLVAMAHLAQAPSAIVHLSGDFTPTAKALLWHTPPAIRKTTSAEELSREWVYDIFFDPTLPRHELEAFHHELGPLDPLRQEPPDREFHDDRYLTDHQRVLEIGNRVNFNTLSL